ncbi:hypothetical protein FXO38_04229 [Capsicum annuum]|nr:hypothetical protein FXO38_04229 [Capsicum annuum]
MLKNGDELEVYVSHKVSQPDHAPLELEYVPNTSDNREIIRKELDIHVGATTVRRAGSRVIQDIMGDHIMEYGRIFYYRDEILRTNPESFNAWVLPAKFKTIITMLEEIKVGASTGRGRGRAKGNGPSHAARTSYQQDHKDNDGGNTRPFKRPRMVGIGIYQAEDGFTTLNPGMPSRRVISTGAKVTKRSDIMTGDIGYIPKQGFKWKGKSVITNRKLERMRAEKVIKTRSAAAAKTQGKIFQLGRLMCHGSRTSC